MGSKQSLLESGREDWGAQHLSGEQKGETVKDFRNPRLNFRMNLFPIK